MSVVRQCQASVPSTLDLGLTLGWIAPIIFCRMTIELAGGLTLEPEIELESNQNLLSEETKSTESKELKLLTPTPSSTDHSINTQLKIGRFTSPVS